MIKKILSTIKLTLLLVTAISLFLAFSFGCSSQKKGRQAEVVLPLITTNEGMPGLPISVEFRKGPAHNHPLMAIWIEDTNGRYIETLFIAQSIGTGIFGHGQARDGRWEPGPVSRPAALPYWWHKFGYLPSPEYPAPDAITGPTPKAGFILSTVAVNKLPVIFNVMLEINQPWDWNEHWTNDKYPGNDNYMTSSQPALVYKARPDIGSGQTEFTMQLAGHSHFAGEDGNLYDDFSSITTARDIAGRILVRIGSVSR